MRIISCWDRHFLSFELGVAVAATVAVAIYAFVVAEPSLSESPVFGNRITVYRTAATVGSALLGFTGTIVAVIYGLIDAERLKHLRRSEHRDTMWRVFFSTMRSLALLVIISFVGLIVDHQYEPIVWIAVAFFFAGLLSLFRVARSVWLLQRIIEIMALPSPSDR